MDKKDAKDVEMNCHRTLVSINSWRVYYMPPFAKQQEYKNK